MPEASTKEFRFGVFTYSLESGELRKGGSVLRLQEQPRRILERLLEKGGEMVTRQELQNELWPDGVNVDFDASLNVAVRRLRQALLDDADQPRYIETVPRKGYRFIAPLVRVPQETSAPPANPVHSAPVAATPALIPQTPISRRRRLLGWLLASGLAAVALAVFFMTSTTRDAHPRPATRTSILIPPQLQLDGAGGGSVAISEDGQIIAFSAASSNDQRRFLYRRHLSEPGFEPVTGSEGALAAVFPSDGGGVVWSTRTGLFQSSGAAVHSLFQWGGASSTPSFRKTPSGDLLITRLEPLPEGAVSGLAGAPWILRKGRPAPDRLPTRYQGQGLEIQYPQQIVDDRYLLFSSNRGSVDRSVDLLDLRSGEQKTLVKPAMGGKLLPGGKLLYYWNGDLLLAPFDRATSTLTAPGVVVLSGVSEAGWTGPNADVALNGTLVYVPARQPADTRLVWVNLEGQQSPVPVPAGPLRVADLSLDGRHLLLFRQTGADIGKLQDYDLKTGSTQELVSEVDWRACWSSDAGRVFFSKTEQGEPLPTLHAFDIANRQTERWLPFRGAGQFAVQAVQPNSQLIYLTGYQPKTQVDIGYASTLRNTEPTPLIADPGVQTHPRVSPDGKWIAYTERFPSGTVVVRSMTDHRVSVQIGSGSAPQWSADGRSLYYRSATRFFVTSFMPGVPPQIGKPRVLFEGDYLQPQQWVSNTFFDAGSRRFLLSVGERPPDAPARIEVITNWLDEIRRR